MNDEQSYLRNAEIILSDSLGQYIPRYFAQDFRFAREGVKRSLKGWCGTTKEQREILCAGPEHEHEHYWEVWDEVLANAYCYDRGTRWTLYQDGDLWQVPSRAPMIRFLDPKGE